MSDSESGADSADEAAGMIYNLGLGEGEEEPMEAEPPAPPPEPVAHHRGRGRGAARGGGVAAQGVNFAAWAREPVDIDMRVFTQRRQERSRLPMVLTFWM